MPRKLSFPTSASSLSLSSTGTGSGSTPATPTTATPPTSSAANIPPSLADPSLPFPRLVVFDLDYTLWPFWVDTHVTPPLKINAAHTAATDRCGEDFAFYGDVPAILQLLPHLGGGNNGNNNAKIKLGVASRTSAPSLARDLLKGLHLPPEPGVESEKRAARRKATVAIDVFDGGLEIYPGSKIKHFEALQKRTGVRFEDMLFFDDEARNRETERLGVTMRLVRDGVTWEEIGQGVEEWRRRRVRMMDGGGK